MKNKKNWLLKYLIFVIVTFIIVSVIYFVLEKTGNGNIITIIAAIAAVGSAFFKLRGKPSSLYSQVFFLIFQGIFIFISQMNEP